MPQNESLTITFTGADSSSGLSGSLDPWLRLEQPDWPGSGGAAGFSAFLLTKGINPGDPIDAGTWAKYWDEYNSECEEGDSGCIETEIWVHKFPADLDYRMECSWGELGSRMQEETEHVTSVQINLEDHYEFYQANVTRIIRMEWEGAVYQEDGSQVHRLPSAIYANGIITFPYKVFGILRITYRMGYDKYPLKIYPRDEGEYDTQDMRSAYESTVMAFFSGQVVTHDVSLPDLQSEPCSGGGSRTEINPDDEGDCYNLYIKKHKCTGEIISEELRQVPCPKSA